MAMPMLTFGQTSCSLRYKGCDRICCKRSAILIDLVSVAYVLQEHHELVRAQAGDAVVGAQDGFETHGDIYQQLISGQVAEAVVNDLETVDVKKEDAEMASVVSR
ncbi:MAG: hypothetical protein WKF84_01035 [Pyrinomonadaceae bacterium]